MGISPAELLLVTSLIMLNGCSIAEEILRCNFVFDASLGRRALIGGERITAVSNRALAHAILEAYSTLNIPD
jgi:hypothetical protein